ncbi:hypothetical protein NHF50_14985 [Flavobacterium sp. NRK F10]|uniref:hypothetical protein n=1 Tax=Flavobacterium sp. NRK F10 TaxID=2954931 RepID=UPI002091D719|nr:hypothetical protein [Flavobacterium sp. NRK F10]MCO6176354.1 hypothetical protein [Flavobacterium sp. NRK F10]
MNRQSIAIKSGFWRSEGGNPFWIKFTDNHVFWLGMNNKTDDSNLGETWCHVGFGEINGDLITLKWSDISVGKDQLNGNITIQVISETEMMVIEDSGNFGKSKWIWESENKNFSQF